MRLMIDDLGPYVKVKGHRLWQTGNYIWCSRCGSHTDMRIKGLAGQCHGGGRCYGGIASRRDNLAAGRAPRAPVSAAPIGRPTRLTLRQWVGWKGLLAADGDADGEAICDAWAVDAVQGDDGEGED